MVAATALITVVAVESGAISGYATAANAMADSMGLKETIPIHQILHRQVLRFMLVILIPKEILVIL